MLYTFPRRINHIWCAACISFLIIFEVWFASYIFHTILAKSTSCLNWHCVNWFGFPKLRPTVIDVPKYSPAQRGKWTDAHLGDSNKILFWRPKNTFWVPSKCCYDMIMKDFLTNQSRNLLCITGLNRNILWLDGTSIKLSPNRAWNV